MPIDPRGPGIRSPREGRAVLTRREWLAVAAAGAAGLARGAAARGPKWHPGHYVFIGHGAIGDGHLAEHFRGVQRCYAWNRLEPGRGRYDFEAVRADLDRLRKLGRHLVLQLQYKAFGKDARCTPSYLEGPDFGGGVYRASSGSFNPVIWNAAVGDRMEALLAALGREFDRDAALEAVVLPETAPSANLAKAPQAGVDRYTPDGYAAALERLILALRKAFPGTVVIQYTNFPGDLLERLTTFMKEAGVGLGGPDVYPRPDAVSDPVRGIYRFYPGLAGHVPLGAAVQSPNYSVAAKKRTAMFDRGRDRAEATIEPGDETPIPVREHLDLARKTLKLNYLFWSASPRECLANVKRMLAEPDLAGDPAGGLVTALPTRAFARPS
jgi:hypothetical protein